MDISAALTQVSAGLTAIRQIYDAGHEFDKAQLKLRVAELIGGLTQAQLALTEAQETLRAKDKEIASLKEAFRRSRDEMVEKHGVLYRKSVDGKPQGLPYCSRCEEVDGLLVRTLEIRGGDAKCPQCNAVSRVYIYGWDGDA